MLPTLSHEEILRYSRHLLIPDVGLEGQRKLKAASVLIIGTGGLGSPAALYLAAAGIGHIGLVDYDVVDLSNLQRQVIHGTATVGKLKVESARGRMLDLNPDIQVDVYNQPFTSANAVGIAEGYDLIVDGLPLRRAGECLRRQGWSLLSLPVPRATSSGSCALLC
jgi:molybdopterin/thiamine biosynthesis adenylyltransferase